MPKRVSPEFSPFPLPKYDKDLGFGPVRMRDVPDIDTAERRMRAHAETYPAAVATAVFEGDETGLFSALSAMGDEAEVATGPSTTEAVRAPSPEEEMRVTDEEDDVGGGYRVDERFPVLDRLHCERSVDDLLTQFMERPAVVARTATILDLASTMQARSDTEVERVLYELGSLFAPDGNGLQFLVVSIVKFGRPYHVSSSLTTAYIRFVNAATEAFVRADPQRLAHSPSLFIQLLHFLALIKVLDPNRWYSANPNAGQNRADYSHPRGVNRHTAHLGTGEELVDFMVELVRDGANGESSPFLDTCTPSQQLDILGGFAGVMKDGKPEGEVTRPIVRSLFARWASEEYELRTEDAADQLERLYLQLALIDSLNDTVLHALLGDTVVQQHSLRLRTQVPLRLSPSLSSRPRGPDFFAAVSHDRRQSVKAAAVGLLDDSLRAANEKQDEALVQALMESGMELLLTLKDKDAAVGFACRHRFDSRVLRAIPSMTTVADRLEKQQQQQQQKEDRRSGARYAVVSPSKRSSVQDVQATRSAQLEDSVAEDAAHRSASYLAEHLGKSVHPIRTLLTNLDYVNSVDNVYVVHSSAVETSADQLISAVRRLHSGKDSLVVTTSCLRAIAVQSYYAPEESKRRVARKALDVLSFELEKGRVVLVPLSEELAVHDAGCFCDEDLMLWTLAALFAREMPLVKVHTLMSRTSLTYSSFHRQHGGHSPLARASDLFNPSVPLLSALRGKELTSVTHRAKLQKPVKDRPTRMFTTSKVRARFLYRRDKALFDRFHVTARNVAPGFGQGGLDDDMRGLGFYTPDHPQPRYSPNEPSLLRYRRSVASSSQTP